MCLRPHKVRLYFAINNLGLKYNIYIYIYIEREREREREKERKTLIVRTYFGNSQNTPLRERRFALSTWPMSGALI
jgi:hypothetical protein